MRWKHKVDNRKERVVNKFLFFPKTLLNPHNNDEETRWFEFATIKQEISETEYGPMWFDETWVD